MGFVQGYSFGERELISGLLPIRRIREFVTNGSILVRQR